MKIIEHRRHSIRIKPSKHLSQEGVNLARRVGNGMEYFDQVYSSTAPRAIDTAFAMGYSVDETLEMISQTPEDIENDVEWGTDFQGYLEAYQRSEAVAKYSKELADFHQELVSELPNSSKVLIISHGGLIELAAIGCFPNEDYASWGGPLDCCEGVRIYLDKGEFQYIELLRVESNDS